LVQRREDQLARREAEEAENKLAEERAKVGSVPCTLNPWPWNVLRAMKKAAHPNVRALQAELARKRKEKVEEIALEKERTKTERRDRLRAGYRCQPK
jgi:hypothetical protein